MRRVDAIVMHRVDFIAALRNPFEGICVRSRKRNSNAVARRNSDRYGHQGKLQLRHLAWPQGQLILAQEAVIRSNDPVGLAG